MQPICFTELGAVNRLFLSDNSIRYKNRPADFAATILHNIWTDTITGSFTESKVFVVQTNPKIVERCLLMTTDPGDLGNVCTGSL
jgi:adenine-specific DNA-methyltransferase